MDLQPTPLQELFTLNLLAPGLTAFVPPSGPFDPAGEWTQRWGVHTLNVGVGRVGQLTLTRRKTADGLTLALDYEKHGPIGVFQKTAGTLDCAADALATPRRWQWTTDMVSAPGSAAEGVPLAGMRLEKSATLENGHWTRACGGVTRHADLPGPVALNWALFEAVQRLPRALARPLAFTLIDDLDQPKPEQELRAHEEALAPLPAAPDAPLRLHSFRQLGRGIVPWIYWLDEQGRLLFAVAGIEAYILESNGREG
jgi:hypothetical protein